MTEQAIEAAAKYLIGLVGAILSLQWMEQELKWSDRCLMGMTGALSAGWLTPAALELIGLTSHNYEYAAAFLVGLYAWSIMGGVMKAIRSVNWLKVFYEIIRILRK